MINVVFEKDILKNNIIDSSTNTYSIIKEISRGVNGIVFYAKCIKGEKINEYVAIKILHNRDSKLRYLRFSNEYSFLKSSNHENIIQVYELGDYVYKNEVYPFFVMPFYKTTLDELINENSLSFGKKVSYAIQILSAMKYIKSRGFIHRDLKPKNILVNDDSLVLCDFGILKQIEPWLEPGEYYKIDDYNRESVPYAFRSPEIVEYIRNGSKLTYHSDVFQIGLSFCMLFCGEHPLLLEGDYTKKLEPIRFKKTLDELLSNLREKTYGDIVANMIKEMLIFKSSKKNEAEIYLKQMKNLLKIIEENQN